jgi:sensor histidine kinase regulating citrate/malate metabolism
MPSNLDTTNMWLAIMAIVSLLEALLLVGIGIGAFLAYRRVMQLVTDLEARQIAPVREKVDAILGDVKAVTARVSQQTERVNHAISDTMERVDDTAGRVTGSVRDKVNHAVGLARGIRAMVMSVLGHDGRHEPPAPAAGRV